MEVKQYTEENYVPLSELKNLKQEFFNEIKEYRNNFTEIIKINDLYFASLVETPKLIKKRFSKNIELKDAMPLNLNSFDYILEIAKLIVLGKKIDGIKLKNINKIKNLFEDNNKDLTIVTNYLVNNLEEILEVNHDLDISRVLPELNKYELMFIKSNNNDNLNYSIQDFLKTTSSSYETARKGLEKLFNLKLFDKNKVGKKFVYKPTKKLNSLVKGGYYGS